jgi:hypothetical protein
VGGVVFTDVFVFTPRQAAGEVRSDLFRDFGKREEVPSEQSDGLTIVDFGFLMGNSGVAG